MGVRPRDLPSTLTSQGTDAVTERRPPRRTGVESTTDAAGGASLRTGGSLRGAGVVTLATAGAGAGSSLGGGELRTHLTPPMAAPASKTAAATNQPRR